MSYSFAESLAAEIEDKINELLNMRLKQGDIVVEALQHEVRAAYDEMQRREDVSGLLTRATNEILELKQEMSRRDARIRYLIQFKPKDIQEPDFRKEVDRIADVIKQTIKKNK